MATNIPVPVFRVNGASALVIFLYVAVMFGAAHLAAISKPDAKISRAWLSLGF